MCSDEAGGSGSDVVASMGHVMVLGVTGSVGSQLCDAFARRGWRVYGVARQPRQQPRVTSFTAMDVTAADPTELAAMFDAHRLDAVVNAAGGWGDTVEGMTYSHLRLVDRLLEGLALARCRPRLVHIGSVHEYGPAPAGVMLTEDAATRPITAYARTKLATSRKVLAEGASGMVDAVVFRSANMSGPHPPQESFLAALMERIRRTLVTGDQLELSVADARRDFIDVRDVAEAAVCAASAKGACGVINIGRGEAVPMRDLVGWMLAAARVPDSRITHVDKTIHSKGGDWTCLDISRARRVLAWEPTITLHDSIRDMWREFSTPMA